MSKILYCQRCGAELVLEYDFGFCTNEDCWAFGLLTARGYNKKPTDDHLRQLRVKMDGTVKP